VLNENLMEDVLNRGNLIKAYKRVKANGGAPGVDGMSVDAFAEHARQHWPGVAGKLQTGDYHPGAIRGVSIPKAQGGERILGIPNVQDRVIQQATSQVLSPIFEAQFSDHSYGYRPGRSAHDAIRAASGYVLEGKTWVVDLDISAFFDEVNHDILMAKIGREIRDTGESLFLRKIFRKSLTRKIGKNYATTNACGGPDSSASPRFDPTRGQNFGSHMT
jgi:group II intron reverse transcriptase/maturase